jgi:serine phosphatase RsbU (regulator of sigma subunit)
MAGAAAAVGLLILGAWFTRYWPAASWTVLPRGEQMARAREMAHHFGVNADGGKAELAASVSKPLARYAEEHPDDVSAHAVSPLTVRITLFSPKKEQMAEVGLDSGGLPIYWKPSEDVKPAKKYASEDEAAREAFGFLAAGRAAAFAGPVKSMGDHVTQEQYVWKKAPAAHSEARERITVLTENGGLLSAERKVYLSSESDEEDSDDDEAPGYWGVLSGIFWAISIPGILTILSIYVLWSMRKALNNRFQGRLAIVVAVVIVLAQLLGANAKGANWGELWIALEILCFAGVGRGISSAAKAKWRGLEQLCRLAPAAKATGESLGAGVLYGPLLAAIPFLIAGCGLFPHSRVSARHLEILYSPAALLDSGDLSAILCLLGFFGFGVPVLERLIRFRGVRWLIAVPAGTVFFAYEMHGVSGPLAAPLAAGFCTLCLFWFLYARFDLLAVLTLALSSGAVASAFVLAQKGLGIGWLVFAWGVALGFAMWLARYGADVSEGDPLATNPALTGFRAEREKLRAEFSVARRAQEGMLPQAPPDIPGYSIAASCTPSLEVGGDLYDFLKLPDGRIGIGVADVSGKGVPAALYMTLTKGLLAAVSKDRSELVSVVEEVNRHLHGVTRKKVFVTMALGFLDAERRVMQCVRAGHNPVVWRQASQDVTTLVAHGGLGLGITASRVFSTQLKMVEIPLAEGDAVVFYSDGVTEAMNRNLEQFGEQRLMEAVEKTDRLDAAAARDSILSEVRAFLGGVHPQDDMTLVVLRVGR